MNDRLDLQAILAYWQKALRLLDWRVEIGYVPDLQLNGDACYGLCTPFVDDKAALVQIRDPQTPIDPSRDPAAVVERAVVHELLHLWWAPAGFRRPVEIAHEENAVWAITDALIAQKAGTLLGKLGAMFPDLEVACDCAWAGTFAETKDGLPLIGPHPKFPRGLFALGYGGNGITFGLIAARLLRDRILGKTNDDLAIFRLDR